MSFATSPLKFIEGDERASALLSLREYFTTGKYTGAFFEQMIDLASPFEISARDIVAVTALGVDVPVRASHWILGEGQSEISDRLRALPPEVPIWDSGDLLAEGSDAWQLWKLLDDQPGVGTTITSKLLAAKRPHLLPIWDQYVVKGVDPAPDEYWAGWRECLMGAGGESLRAKCESLRAEAGVSESVSILRILDVVIWMRVHGYDYGDAPRFWEKVK